jgi:hypothetical protein
MRHVVKKMSPVRRWVTAGVTTSLLAGAAAAWVALPAGATGRPVSYAGPHFPSSVVAPSADKPQSKVWKAGLTWYSIMASATTGAPTIHRRNANHTWSSTGIVVDSRLNSTADAQLVGTKLYVASRTATGNLIFIRYSVGGGTYVRDAGFPVTLATGGSESLSFARDSTGQIWATWTRVNRVYLAHTNSSDASWSSSLVPVSDNTVAADDISAIAAFKGHVGIMWSDQQSSAFRLAVHSDTAGDGTWTLETPLSGAGNVDDHVSLKAVTTDASGRLFAAVKTALDMPGNGGVQTSPIIYVLARSSSGSWTRSVAGTVADKLTRPQLALDSTHGRLFVLMTSPDAGGNIYVKSSLLSSLTFPPGRGSVFITGTGALLNNVSAPKSPVNAATGLLAIASDDGADRYYHGEVDLSITVDQTPPISPASATATALSSTSVRVAWPTGSDDQGIKDYLVYRNNVQIATTTSLSYTDNTATSGTTYTYGVKTRDLAGNTSGQRQAAPVTTP